MKFAELFYITIARDISLNPIPKTELETNDEKPKRREGNLVKEQNPTPESYFSTIYYNFKVLSNRKLN
ncbi:MAG TPA: hypothetical protein VK177_16870 [Flavobacteriales bacterium]|nr:hypothetical protein [Flavobacteriales bacterium]